MSEPVLKGTLPADLKARMKASYDAIATTYNTKFYKVDDTLRTDYLGRLVTLLLSRKSSDAKPSFNVLELGCGAGVPATKFLLDNKDVNFTITGNDISTSQLDLARQNLAGYVNQGRLSLHEGDMLALSFPEETFDAITAFYSIIHLPRDEQTELMRMIGKWLKPGGYFLANFSVRDMLGLEAERWLEHEQGWMFWSGWGEEGSVKMVEGVGLKVLVKEVRQAVGDEAFVWVLAQKGG
ncbi:hypothetical protein ACET3X_002084 [Alternaria dauci]|uniref:Methyltransferase domain-containing protein n=1 Tax=Alternaria dauci TaxID=48095 RepID=A0ABR3UZ56_9PLEO